MGEITRRRPCLNNLTGHDHGGTENGVQLDTTFIPKADVIESMQQRVGVVRMQVQVFLVSNFEVVKVIAHSKIVQQQIGFIWTGCDMESGLCIIGEYTIDEVVADWDGEDGFAIDEVVADWTGKMDLPLFLGQYPCYPRMRWIRCSNRLPFVIYGIDKGCITRLE